MLIFTVLGAYNAVQTCQQLSTGPLQGITDTGASTSTPIFSYAGTLLEALPLGIAECVLSLSTNVFTTLMVAYKAWCVP